MRAVVAAAAADGTRLEIRGGGSKAAIGAPDRQAAIVDMRRLSGVIDYDPAELVLTVRAGTPLAEIEALIAGQGQMLAFEPFDHGPLFGQAPDKATIGGVVAAGVAGSARLTAGGCRDHVLGFEGVSGRGEIFVGGAKVVKNVTGYDLPKLVAGSWGRLVALTQVTLKVLPRPRVRSTLVLEGLSAMEAQAAMACAMRSHWEVAAAAHLPSGSEGTGAPLTLLRVQGFGPSVAARTTGLSARLSGYGRVQRLDEQDAQALWVAVRVAKPLADAPVLWRVNVPPSAGPAVVGALEPLGARWLFDWAGGLVWLAFDGDPDFVRTAAASAGGHAVLLRAPAELRARVLAFHPLAPGVAALEARVRAAFDPDGVFESGRFLDMPHAD